MRVFLALGAAFMLLASGSYAQTSVTRTYIKGGRDAWTNYLREIYLQENFEKGIVEYKNGRRYQSLLNYNRALGAIQFIDENGDTLALTDEENIKLVTFSDETFYTEPVYMQRVAGNKNIVLAKHERSKQTDRQKTGAMGIPNSAGTIDSYDRSYSRNNHFLDIDEQLLIRKVTAYYIAGPDMTFHPANKKTLLALFPGKKSELNDFITKSDIDFTSEEDLLSLVDFTNNL